MPTNDSPKLMQLTKEQEACIIPHRDKWIALGHSTEPIDLGTAVDRLRSFYRQASLPDNFEVVHLESPLACALEWNRMRREEKPDEGDDNQVPLFLWGNHDIAWLAWTSYFREVCGVDIDPRELEWCQFAQAAHWVIPCRGVAFFAERPTEIHVTDAGLHNETGPAIRYNDDFSVHAVGGHRVHGWIIEEPHLITVPKIKEEEDAEVRRIMRERYGEGKYLADIGAKVLHVDQVAVDAVAGAGSIMRALMEDDEGNRFLVGSDGSTPRVYYMRVPKEVSTCTEAAEALSGFEEAKCLAQG